MPTPLYQPSSERGAYQLRYSWTAWPSLQPFSACPTELLSEVAPLWETDGLRLLEYRWLPDKLQILFSAQPHVSPAVLAGRAKGRLHYALRKADLNLPLSRKVSVRTVGDNTRRDVEAYLESQVPAAQFVDERFAAMLKEMQVVDEAVDLAQPSESLHGRYWYNLHMVLVVDGRQRIVDGQNLRTIRDGCLRIAAKKEHRISRLAVLPDHLHAAIRPGIEESPLDVVFAYQNNLAHLLGGRVWQDSYYVGTFGEYSMSAIRERAEDRGEG
jgi:REP element-mobilizing transposase RayT